MKNLPIVLIALLLLPAGLVCSQQSATVPQSAGFRILDKNDRKLAWAYENKISGFRVTCSGVVVNKLPDDLADIRHQRFIIKLESGQTLLIVHNIDLAKRVKPLRFGDKVRVRGEYIWNDKGGLIHYTHRDPTGILPSGWIRRKGVIYY